MATSELIQSMLDDFVDTADTGFEVCVVWTPSQSNPITCDDLRVNNLVIASDQAFRNSPISHQVVPSADGEFCVDWSFTSDVPRDGIVIGIINWKTKNKIEVGSQTKLKAGATWADRRKVNAP